VISGAGGATPPAAYAAAGVDIDAGDKAVARIKAAVSSTAGPEVIGDLGGFAGCFALDTSRFTRPVLAASTDGVGTKLEVAKATGRFGTVGIDLVAMCVDDLVCLGAEPLFLLDYIATQRIDPEQIENLVSGIVAGCRLARCALIGGEMAEHVDGLPAGGFDLAGFAVGVVDRDAMLGPARVLPGDVLVGLPSPGLRSNGYTLARRVLLERAQRHLDGPAWPGADHSLADELLLPSVVYAPAVMSVMAALGAGTLHAAAHITGGGIPGNLARVLPSNCDAVVYRNSWRVPRIFEEIQRLGAIDDQEMTRVFNLGVGMMLVVAGGAEDVALSTLRAAGDEAIVVGEVVDGHGDVRVTMGTYLGT
jgi:phosphoribosylformylglycinamidine cyclo-ligase